MRWVWGLALVICLGVGGIAVAKELSVCPERGVQPFLGLDDTSVPAQVRDGRAIDLQNVELDISRSVRKRRGITTIGDTCDVSGEDFPPITGLYFAQFSSGTDRIVRTCSNRFEYLNGTDWQVVSGANTVSGTFTITPGANGVNQWMWATALDNIIGTNGVDFPIRYTGSALTLVDFTSLPDDSDPTRANAVAFFKNYLIFGGTVEGGTYYPTRFRWSNVGEINDYEEENFTDIDALGGQELITFAELYDNLYAFLTHSIYKVSLVGGVNTFNISKVSDTIGTISKNSVQSVTLTNLQRGLLFLDRSKRVYFFNGIYPQEVSPLIQRTMDGLKASRLPSAVSADTGTDYYLCVSENSSAINDLCLDLQYQIGEWTKHRNLHANAMVSLIDSTDVRRTYFGNYHGLVQELGVDSTDRVDVANFSGTVSTAATTDSETASGLQVLYFTGQNFTTGSLIGAPLEVVGGTASGATGIIVSNDASGIIVFPTISPTPTSTSQVEVGAIDAFYTSKWYDMALPVHTKHFGEVYFWADADVTSTLSVQYATDFNSTVSTQNFSLSSSSTDDTWGALRYGNLNEVFRQVKLEAEGRNVSVTFRDDDPNEVFHLHGWNTLYWMGEP